MVWHPDGFLKKMGFMDFAGGIPVEMVTSEELFYTIIQHTIKL